MTTWGCFRAVERADRAVCGRVALTWLVGAATVTIFGSGMGHGPPVVSLAGLWREGRVVALGGAMLTVETDAGAVEQRLGSGRLACPGCSAVLAGWGHARGRQVRDTDGELWITPRRARCTGCGATHVLLPVVLLVRRADTAAVIGAGLTAKATGAGHRLIAALLGRPPETVRGWLRRFACRVAAVRAVFTRWCRDLAPDPVLPEPAGSAWAARSRPSAPRPWRCVPGSPSARCRSGRSPRRSRGPGCWPRAGPLRPA
jgi:Domain of unknown function (DUF6431)